MTLNVTPFGSCGSLVEFVNTNSIAQTNIQKIAHVDGQWYLFYWTE
jgi:hypothetical protein